MASLSTPIPYSTDLETETNKRPRRHTITRPDSALELLSEDDSDEEIQQEALDRISDILANLIQEANEAVNGIEKERMMIKSVSLDSRRSRIPRPKRLVIQPALLHSAPPTTQTRPTKKKQSDPIIESFRRLDSSMAMVDSLSRDLASEDMVLNSRLMLFLLMPLLHIPHSFITMLFDLCYSHQIRQTSIFDIPSMLVWTCLLALANLVVGESSSKDKSKAIRPKVQLPGSFIHHKTAIHANKRTWIPSTVQTHASIPTLVRRNSV
ncbi:hypothetical protein A0J61_03971 [Choanephora cucurbitarum]|uniref:Uncharacterized protein n=1 Tax=Choanephora cucurbitarum TaxID=101091 RepID=A0A1C7NFV8_9FUNG|nr:hypothetical protein A0J61_03971 [Choanephora cucurbitarum]